MNKKVNKKIEEYKDELPGAVQKLVQIKSIESHSKQGKPFGEGIFEALDTALTLADMMGFKTKNLDGYAGYAQMGSGDELICILCHLDVVPEGDNWTYPPFGGEIHDNKIFGRGTIDDKGPAMAVLYAMKAIYDLGIELNKRVRIIFGTDEESGWEGIEYYLARESTADAGFTPDAEFPVIHAEKGITVFDLKKDLNEKGKTDNGLSQKAVLVKEIKGGNAANMVPDYCQARLVVNDTEAFKQIVEENKYKLDIEVNGQDVILKAYGKSSHGSLPEEGENAISILMVFLHSLYLLENDIKNLISFYGEKIGLDFYGKEIGCFCEDDVSGKLIFNVGMIDINQHQAKITINIRYPVTCNNKEIYQNIKKSIKEYGLVIDEKQHLEPLYLPESHSLVKTLNKVYAEVTGEKASPVAIGGGTYARSMDNIVAYGALFPGKEKLAHKRDEYIDIDDLLMASKIYGQAILALALN